MVCLATNTPEYYAELCDEVRFFLDERKIPLVEAVQEEGYTVWHSVVEKPDAGCAPREGKGRFIHTCVLYLDGRKVGQHFFETPSLPDGAGRAALEYKRIRKRGAKIAVFRCLKEYFGKEKPWGSLTGVRPTKFLRDSQKKLGIKEAERMFLEDMDLSRQKYELVNQICRRQQPVLSSIQPQDLDIYVGIPFCTSRCAYCSFAAMESTRDGALEEKYVDALIREMHALRDIIAARRVRSVYLGGGTPTALAPCQLERVLEAVAEFAQGEFTVEAGRPDTITPEKLSLIRQAGANRISVNPQTTCQATLDRIGRSHRVEEFFKAAKLAAGFGFAAVNMDLIVGLPGEGRAEFARSLLDVLALKPENITVHTLAIKRGSRFGQENAHSFADAKEAEAMLAQGAEQLERAGYAPYYLYRQKYMTGNLENVGYALPGKESIYNIDIMEEAVSILAFGAGAISKVVESGDGKICRAAAPKNVEQYIRRIQEMAQRKRALFCGQESL